MYICEVRIQTQGDLFEITLTLPSLKAIKGIKRKYLDWQKWRHSLYPFYKNVSMSNPIY